MHFKKKSISYTEIKCLLFSIQLCVVSSCTSKVWPVSYTWDIMFLQNSSWVLCRSTEKVVLCVKQKVKHNLLLQQRENKRLTRSMAINKTTDTLILLHLVFATSGTLHVSSNTFLHWSVMLLTLSHFVVHINRWGVLYFQGKILWWVSCCQTSA